MTSAITFIHCDEKLVYVNPAATQIMGYSREELLGRHFWELIDPPFREEARARAHARLRGEVVPEVTEVRLRTKSGEPRWLHLTAAVIDYEHRRGVLGTAFDITEQKRATKELRQNQKRLRALLEHSSDLVTLTDDKGEILYVSPNIGRMLGYDGSEVVGINALDLVHPHDVEATFKGYAALLGHPGRSVTLLYRCRHKNGSYRWMESVGTNVSNDLEGSTVLINKRDVTDRLRAEDDARQRRAELAHVLRVAAVSEMASALAHEINQPLSAIVNYARGCLRSLERSRAPNELEGALEEIAGQAMRAEQIVSGLKRFVRKEPPRRAPIDLNRLVENVVRLLQSEIHDRGLDLRRDLADDLPALFGDAVLIEQVIFNVLRNGIEAVVRGGGPGWLSVRTAMHNESRLEVAIADSGPGLPSSHEAALFEPFFTTKGNGLGMGLTISRTIAEAHGGYLTAERGAVGGSLFRLVLPVTGEEEHPDTAAAG
jgi:two-component system, LuxR family, sensor kinase FixL